MIQGKVFLQAGRHDFLVLGPLCLLLGAGFGTPCGGRWAPLAWLLLVPIAAGAPLPAGLAAPSCRSAETATRRGRYLAAAAGARRPRRRLRPRKAAGRALYPPRPAARCAFRSFPGRDRSPSRLGGSAPGARGGCRSWRKQARDLIAGGQARAASWSWTVHLFGRAARPASPAGSRTTFSSRRCARPAGSWPRSRDEPAGADLEPAVNETRLRRLCRRPCRPLPACAAGAAEHRRRNAGRSARASAAA